MKKIFILLALLTMSITINAQSYKKEGNTYSSTGRVGNSSTPITTGCTWIDSKGKSYPVFMSPSSGSCYIIKVSAKSGKEYKHYLGAEISQDICKKLGKEYKGKKK